MVTTTSLKVGESLTIGLYFNDNYQLPTTCNLVVFIGGVCVGNLFTQEPEIEKVDIYYTIRLSSQDTSKMRGYRDLIVVLDDPEGFGNKKFIVGGILFDRMADEFITTSENQGYNMLIGMTVDESIVSGNIELIEAIKGEKGDRGEQGIQGESGEDAVLPDGIVIDENYVHTDNNYTNADKTLLSTALQSESDPVYALDKDRLLNTSGVNTGDQDLSGLLPIEHLSDFNHADIFHSNRVDLDSVSGINTGDQDLSGLVEKVPLHSLVPDMEIDKLAEYPQFPETPEGYYLADDGTFKALPDFVTDSEMIDYVGSEMAAGSVVIKEYVDEQDALKVDKVSGKGLSTEDYTTAEKGKVANVPLNTNAELGLKVDKVEGSSLVPDTEINKLSEYPEFEDLEFSHENLTDKNSEEEFQHVDTTTVKPTLDEADKVALYDSVTGGVVLTPKSSFVENKELLLDYTHSGNKEIYIQSVDVDLNTFTSANHGLSNGNILWPVFNDNLGDKIAGSVMPGGFTTFRNYPGYYVVNSTTNTFQLSTTINGTAIDITTNPNMDLNRWHFEDGQGADNYIFSNLKQGLKNVLIKIVGKEKRYGSIGHISVNGQASLPNWHSQVVTSGLWYQNGISCLGNIWSDVEIIVNTQSFIKVTVFALRARQNTSTANTADIIDKISVCTDQNYKGVDIRSIGILNSGFANGLNLKIYQIK